MLCPSPRANPPQGNKCLITGGLRHGVQLAVWDRHCLNCIASLIQIFRFSSSSSFVGFSCFELDFSSFPPGQDFCRSTSAFHLWLLLHHQFVPGLFQKLIRNEFVFPAGARPFWVAGWPFDPVSESTHAPEQVALFTALPRNVASDFTF